MKVPFETPRPMRDGSAMLDAGALLRWERAAQARVGTQALGSVTPR
ncbi:hypothetical protein [Variovorax rhizosphaerae]|uniref:Uncharacterized protein n=1 Tax=Variovorax rhizosphaerae TaxID=1836200 RepID=A0ABU8WNP4_9BURK